MTPVGRTVWALRMIRVYKNGGGRGLVWRYWNPLVWVALPLLLVANVLCYGIPETWKNKHELGVGMNPWFVKHPEQLEWVLR